MKKYLLILLLLAGCTKDKPINPKPIMGECDRCVCNPSKCPVGTAD